MFDVKAEQVFSTDYGPCAAKTDRPSSCGQMARLIQLVLKFPHRPLFTSPTCPIHSEKNKSHLVEYVETPFSRIPHDDARLLQKEVGDFPSVWFAT